MANEATVRSGLQITNGNQVYRSPFSGAFKVDVEDVGGPTPGQILVSTSGTDATFGELTTPCLVELGNFDETNYYEYGIKDASTGLFHPLGEVGPGEFYTLKFSRNLLEEYLGTGTTGPVNSFHLRANSADVNAYVAAFEK